jgi:uncharacterized phage protein (TIGR01671 family)
MEERYLFKAKRVDNGEWVVGGLVRYGFNGKEKYYIVPDYASDLYAIEIDPNTICRCTGSKDKNGILIWENDIVKYKHGNFYKAFWQNNYYQFSWICIKSDVFSIGAKWNLWSFKSFEIEVIGNIFDNPELLESEEN